MSAPYTDLYCRGMKSPMRTCVAHCLQQVIRYLTKNVSGSVACPCAYISYSHRANRCCIH